MINSYLSAQFLQTRNQYVQELSEMGIKKISDLLLYFPKSHYDESAFTLISEMRTDQVNVINVKIRAMHARQSNSGKSILRAIVEDSSGEMPVIWFNQAHIKQMFPVGSYVILSGKLKFENGKISMNGPKYEKPGQTLIHTGRLVPRYAEYKNIQSAWLRKKIYPLLPLCKEFQEDLPLEIIESENLMSFAEAVQNIHFPKNAEALETARQRLAFSEIYEIQLRALERKMSFRKHGNFKQKLTCPATETFLDNLTFSLTKAQNRVINEIREDIVSGHRMNRLLQGDVGSGKTIVAAAALFFMKGRQSALMAPTEILARQHYKNLFKLLENLGLSSRLLLGSMSKSAKEEVILSLLNGSCDVLIGTHALIQEYVKFKDLALVIIDEQHRFGVDQREYFNSHGSPHFLNLSATPIPRTLALSMYGDQDISILDEFPPGRQEIITRIVPEKKRNEAYLWVSEQIQKGRQVFVICPLVEESENFDLKSAKLEYERLQKDVFPKHKVALLHGKMKSSEKDAVMLEFAEGRIDILVSTSVVEVGIDVPNATLMIIEGAERFGLSQLHQFRGRVGRGEHQSYCFLFSDSNSQNAGHRLGSLVKHSNGFVLAELDLEMRGPGELLGVRQSGIPDLKMARFSDVDLFSRVQKAISSHSLSLQ